MADEMEHLTGDDLEQFFHEHGGRGTFVKYQEALKAGGSRVDAWDDGWRLREDPLTPVADIHVYRHRGRMPLDA